MLPPVYGFDYELMLTVRKSVRPGKGAITNPLTFERTAPLMLANHGTMIGPRSAKMVAIW